MLGVLFRRVLVVLGRVQRMPVCHLGVVRRLFVVAGLVVFRCFAMVLGGMFMMVCGLLVVFVNLVTVHRCLPGWLLRWKVKPSPGSMKDLRSIFVS
jgi:hypothetical protein